jgi:hypothetical protein
VHRGGNKDDDDDDDDKIHRMRNIKIKVIPITIRATVTIPKSLGQYLSNIPEKHEIKELQKAAIFSITSC